MALTEGQRWLRMSVLLIKQNMKEHQNHIELPEKPNKDKEQIRLLRQAIKDAKYIHAKYKRSLPEEAWECIGLILNDPKLRAKGGTH